MTYNSNMKRAAIVTGTHRFSLRTWQSGSLARTLAVISILLAILALGIAVFGAATSGNYRSILTHQTLTPFITAGFAIIGALVASRRPQNPIGWIFEAVGQLYALTSLAAAIVTHGSPSSPFYQLASWFGSWIWLPATILPATFVLLLFPDGHLPSRRWRIIAWSAALGLVLVVLGVMFHPGPLVSLGIELGNPFGIPNAVPVLNVLLTISAVLLLIGVFGGLAALLARFHHSAGTEHDQLKWLVYALGMLLLMSILTVLLPLLWPDFRWEKELSIVVTNLGMLGIAVATAIAILRHRLYDIDLIINRTLVYTVLMAGVAALYGLTIVVLGVMFSARSSPVISLLATVLVAILVQPIRDRLQRFVNRLMYGDRDDPYGVLSGLSRRLETSLAPEDTLPAVVETLAQALKLPYVAIALKQAGEFKISASYGMAVQDVVQLPLVYQSETVGQLRLSQRSPNELFTPDEQRLLRDIARHVGVTAHSVRLTQDLRNLAEDLQDSREALVKAREEERRRLRRDLHDELGPQLASLKLNLEVARNLISRDPKAVETLLVDLRTQIQSAIADIRRLVFDLRPPALDELGLAGAIQEYTRQLSNQDGLHLDFRCPKDLPLLPAAVEVAAYRITLEALANIVRHSQAQNCSVSLSVNSKHLLVEIYDDGQGIPEDVQPGVGLNSMRDRAAELGGVCMIEPLPRGGTRVLAELPLS